jgi:carboxymethylenebutenolidase
MICQDVVIPVDGSNMPAHLARPEEGSGPHPAVIVLQEVFGYTPETKRITELLPSIGYVGLAINYYHRTQAEVAEPYTEEGNRRAFEIASRVTAEQMTQDVRAAMGWLNAQPFVKSGKIATWGFGFGGTVAFVTASLRELSGSILFYPMYLTTMPGGGESPLDYAGDVNIPLLMIFGEHDYYVSRFDIDRINQALRVAKKDAKVQIYPNVGHSFFRHGRPQAIGELQKYSDEAVAQACADAWNVVRAFLIDIFNRPQRAAVTGDIRTTSTQSART